MADQLLFDWMEVAVVAGKSDALDNDAGRCHLE
jgi:hypothetical protein